MRIFLFKLRQYLKKHKNRKKYIFCTVILIFLMLIGIIDHKLSDTVISLSETAVRAKTSELLNTGLTDLQDSVDFEDIYSIHYNEYGEITGLFLNSFAVNKIKNSALESVNNCIKNGENTVKIPFGNIFGDGFLSGRGKSFTVKLLSVTAITGEITNKTKDSGVNQTHLSSYININAEVCARVYGENIKTSIQSEILLCESVIVGKVPDTFVKINVLDDETLDWLESYK